MTTHDFHIQQEKLVGKINIAVQTVLNNDFEDQLKKQFANIGYSAANAINSLRKGMYHFLENFDDFNEEYRPENPRFSSVSGESNADTRILHHNIIQGLSEVAAELNSMTPDIIEPTTTTKLSDEEKPGFVACAQSAANFCNDMISLINDLDKTEDPIIPEEKVADSPKMIKHKLTQEDFDENPDLNNKGLSLGDEIEIPELVETQDGGTADELKKNVIPGPPPAVIPKEEIESQNDLEPKGPRKDSGKK